MLSFIDCPNCGKRIRQNAVHCHHCRQELTDNSRDPEHRGHAEHAEGGYNDDDDFDYDEYLEREFGKSNHRIPRLWRYTAWILLLAIMVPIAITIVALLRT